MKNISRTGEYLSPKLKVIELKSRQVICQSPSASIESLTLDDGEYDWGTN